MPARFPLQTLLDHSQHRMEAAERLLRMLKHKEDAAQKRLDELLGYKRDYQENLTGTAGRGMDIHILRDYHVFLAKLEQAIRHQEGEVLQARDRWRAAHDNWLAQRQKVKAYETLAVRHKRQVMRQEDKREQRLMDEGSANDYTRKSGKTVL